MLYVNCVPLRIYSYWAHTCFRKHHAQTFTSKAKSNLEKFNGAPIKEALRILKEEYKISIFLDGFRISWMGSFQRSRCTKMAISYDASTFPWFPTKTDIQTVTLQTFIWILVKRIFESAYLWFAVKVLLLKCEQMVIE